MLPHYLFNNSLKFKCKISAQKEVIHSLKKKKSHFGHVPSYGLTHFKKMARVWKTKSLLILFKIWPTNRFLKANSYNFHFHENDVISPLIANGLVSFKKYDLPSKKFYWPPDSTFFRLWCTFWGVFAKKKVCLLYILKPTLETGNCFNESLQQLRLLRT